VVVTKVVRVLVIIAVGAVTVNEITLVTSVMVVVSGPSAIRSAFLEEVSYLDRLA
jgi:hypothetical protein